MKLGRLSPVESRRPSPVEFISSTNKKIYPRQSLSSPAMVIHPLPRLFLQNQQIFWLNFSSPQSHSLTNIFSSRIILPIIFDHFPQRVKLFIFSSSNPGFIFPQLENIIKTLHIHTSWHTHKHHTTQSHLFWEHHCLIHVMHYIQLTFTISGKIQSNSHKVQVMKPGSDRIVPWFLQHIVKPGLWPDNNIRLPRSLDYDQIVTYLKSKLWSPENDRIIF